MPTSSRCRTKTSEEICTALYEPEMTTGRSTNTYSYFNRQLTGLTVAVAALLVITYMTWDYWYIRKPQLQFTKQKNGAHFLSGSPSCVGNITGSMASICEWCIIKCISLRSVLLHNHYEHWYLAYVWKIIMALYCIHW